MVELQYRGVFFTQHNHRDWTVLAFLQAGKGGLGLDVARDGATVDAMKRALGQLAQTPVDQLKGKRLEVGDFDALLTPDPVRDLLTWLNDVFNRTSLKIATVSLQRCFHTSTLPLSQ